MHLCFRICRLLVFLCSGSFISFNEAIPCFHRNVILKQLLKIFVKAGVHMKTVNLSYIIQWYTFLKHLLKRPDVFQLYYIILSTNFWVSINHSLYTLYSY